MDAAATDPLASSPADQPLFDLRYDLGPEDLAEMSRFYTRHHHTARSAWSEYHKQRRGWLAAGIVGTVAFAVDVVSRGDSILRGESYLPSIVFAAVLVWLWYIVWQYCKAGSAATTRRRIAEYATHPSALYHGGPQRLIVLGDWLRLETRHHDTTQRWTGVDRVDATDAYAFIRRPDDRMFIVPARAFDAPETFNRFVLTCRELADRHLNSDHARVREYLRERDINCPGCGYNLHGCTAPHCPECGLTLDRGSMAAAF